MIWGIVLIPIGLLMAIGIVIFLLSLITIVRFRRRHGITQPLMWWDSVPRDRTSASSHGGRSVTALKPPHRLWGSEGVGRAVPRKSQAQDARPRRHPPGALCIAVLDQPRSLQPGDCCARRVACHTPG